MKPLVVIGAAPCTSKDYQKLLELEIGNHDVLAAGIDALNKIEGVVKYFATYHVADIPKSQEKAYKVISHIQWEDMVDIIRPIRLAVEHSGSSALLGTLVGIDEGYKKIILCGCPLEGKNERGVPYAQFRRGWQFHEEKVKTFVRSMSGWTREFLSEPTKEWLKKEE